MGECGSWWGLAFVGVECRWYGAMELMKHKRRRRRISC